MLNALVHTDLLESSKEDDMRGKAAKEERRARAEVLAEERAKRTPKQQIAVLDARFGTDRGAVKERAQLQKQLESKKG